MSTLATSSATRQTTHRERNPGTRTSPELKQCYFSSGLVLVPGLRSGITGAHVHKEENRIGLRIMYTDSSVQWVILTPSRNTCKTRLVTSFDEESIDEAAARLKYGRQPSTASGSDTWQAPAQWQWHGDTWQAPAQWQWHGDTWQAPAQYQWQRRGH